MSITEAWSCNVCGASGFQSKTASSSHKRSKCFYKRSRLSFTIEEGSSSQNVQDYIPNSKHVQEIQKGLEVQNKLLSLDDESDGEEANN